MKRVLIRVSVLLFVVLLSTYLIASRGIARGLDLKGGVELLVKVVTDEAVRLQPDSDEKLVREEATVQTMRTIQNRLDALGVAEVTLQRHGYASNYQIMIQVPGTSDPKHIKEIIQATALLEFRLVARGPFEDEAAAVQSYGGEVPKHLEIAPSAEEPSFYVLEKFVPLSGRDLKTAFSSTDNAGRPAVAFQLSREGGQRFADLTGANLGKFLAIVLDGRVQSVAEILERISDSGIIQGGREGFSVERTRDLALVLRSGALAAPVRYEHEQVVGPSLGEDSIRAGIVASTVAVSAVTVFMIAHYRLAGVNATVAMLLNLLILLAAMAYFQAPLTLPGIAGIVLTIGVGIDSNVLIFERIREELRAGVPAFVAMTRGFQRVFRTLVDTHLAALISAVFLFMFGSGAVRGFAVTLAIGLMSNMFTSVFVSRTLFELVLGRGSKKPLSI